MPGTRTAPTIASGGATNIQVSLSYIDAQGDRRTDIYTLDASATLAAIEAFVAQMQLMSNASVYKVAVINNFEGDRDTANALAALEPSSTTNGVMSFRNPTLNVTDRVYIPAPVGTLFIANSDTPDLSNTDWATQATNFIAIKATGFQATTITKTRRREINKKYET